MSFRIQTLLICDGGCGKQLVSPDAATISNAAATCWRGRMIAEQSKWTILQSYGPERHFCPECSDKPTPKAKRRKKWPFCKLTT